MAGVRPRLARRREKKTERTIPETMASSQFGDSEVGNGSLSSSFSRLSLPQARVKISTTPSQALRASRGKDSEKQSRAGVQGRDNWEGRFYCSRFFFRWRAASSPQAKKKANRVHKSYRPLPCSPAASRLWLCLSCGVLKLLRENTKHKDNDDRQSPSFPFFFRCSGSSFFL